MSRKIKKKQNGVKKFFIRIGIGFLIGFGIPLLFFIVLLLMGYDILEALNILIEFL